VLRDYSTRRVYRRPAQKVEVDLTDLWDAELYKVRDHEPPPEADYPNYDAAIDAVNAWGKAHGVAYRKGNWAKGKRYRKQIVCSYSHQELVCSPNARATPPTSAFQLYTYPSTMNNAPNLIFSVSFYSQNASI
jgi:hypothetical protein